MKFQKIEKDNYNLYIIKTKKFKTIKVKLLYKRPIKKEEITIRNFINYMLLNSSSKYKTSREIEMETQELYDLGIRTQSFKSGNYHVMSCTADFLHEKYTEPGMINKSLEFLLEIMYRPNIVDNKFDDTYFKIVKRTIEESIDSEKDNPSRYSVLQLDAMLDSNTLSYKAVGYKEDLKKINTSNLYEYYKSVLLKDRLDIFVVGDVSDDIIKIFDKYIPKRDNKKFKIEHYLDIDKLKYKEKIEKQRISQSKLALGYKTDKLSFFELHYVLMLYGIILGGTSDSKLFKNVREKNSLCYYIGTSPNTISKTLYITAGINKENYDKTIELIKEQVNDMSNVTEDELNKAKKTFISGCRETFDSEGSIINAFVSYEYLKADLPKDKIEKVKKVTVKDIKNINKKIHLDSIFFLEGTLKNEEGED